MLLTRINRLRSMPTLAGSPHRPPHKAAGPPDAIEPIGTSVETDADDDVIASLGENPTNGLVILYLSDQAS
jgi:hypothetical protein